MELNLKDKVIIVTGGSKGIGNGICKVLAQEGAIPVIVGRNEDDVLKAVQNIKDNGGQAFYATAGGTKAEGMESALKKAIDFIV